MTSPRRTDLLTLVALGAAAALVIGFLVSRSLGSSSALGAIPADSFLVASIDLWPLSESPLGGAIAGDGGARAGSLLGVSSVQETCGFEPLSHLRTIAIAVPESGEHGEFGVAATGDLSKDQLASCARAVIAKRGGKPATRASGSFTVVSDDASPRSAEVAFRDGGPYLVARRAWLERMIDASEGRTPSIKSSKEHEAIRADLRTRDADAEALVVTAIVPRAERERIEKDMELESPDGGAGRLGSQMQGVLAVSGFGLGLHAGRPGEDTRLVAELRCDNDVACGEVETLILHQRLEWSGDLRLRLGGFGPLIDGLETHRPEPRLLVVKTRAPASDLADVIERLLRPKGAAGPLGATLPVPRRSMPPVDAVITPADGGARDAR